MTSPIDGELLPPESAGVRLPALGTPQLSPEYLAKMKEIIEVLLGRRGSPQWDRAVTFRDLYQAGIVLPNVGGAAPGAWVPSAAPAAQQGGTPSSVTDAALRESAAYRELMIRIGSAEDFARFPDEIRAQLQVSIEALARERQADLRTLDRKIQTASLSLASRLSDITAALDGNLAGVRSYSSAVAEQADSLAVDITNVTARLDNAGGTGVTVEQKLTAQASAISGLQGQWSVKIQAGSDTNPVIAGIDLAVDSPTAGAGTSSLIFLADKFGFVLADSSHAIPFEIAGTRIRFHGDVVIDGTLAIGATGLQPGFEAPGTKNSDVTLTSLGAPATALTRVALGTMHSGGSGNVRFVPNTNYLNAANAGEIKVLGTKFYHPDGTTRAISDQKEISTAFENTIAADPFFVVFTDTDPLTRFGSSGYSTAGRSPNFFAAVYNLSNDTWQAVDNDNVRTTFVPLATDCIVAVGRKTSTAAGSGIDLVSSLLAVNTNLPADGATTNIVTSGTLAARPVGSDGDFYYATDTLIQYQKVSGAWVAGPTTSNTDGRINTPIGGYMSSSGNPVTGAIKISLPQSWTATMLKFTVDIFEYLAGFSCTLDISGYTYNLAGSESWQRVTAKVVGNGSNVEYPVYFGHDGTKCCIWIGVSTETWTYPKVQVRDVLAGHQNYSRSQWETGWALSFDTAAAQNVTASVLDTLPGADWTKIPNRGTRPEDNANYVPPGKGNAINQDPLIEKASAWSYSGIAIGSGTTVSGACALNFFHVDSFGGSGNQKAYTVDKYGIDPAKTYSLTANLYAATGNDRQMYIFVRFYDSAGAQLGATSWGGTETGYVFGGTTPTGVWTRQGGQFGAGTSRAIPATARTAVVGVWFQYSSSGTSSVQQAAQDIRLEPVIGAQLLDPATNTALANFNASNDRNGTAVVAPTVAGDGTAVDHTIRTDGAADLSFEWLWGGAEGDIDGFLVYVYLASGSAAYTFGTTPAAETVYVVPASKRAFILQGVGANLYATFGVQAYRAVDKDINAAGVIKSTLVKPALAAENPYRPSATVAFAGDITGTVSGTAAATVVANAANGLSAYTAVNDAATGLANRLLNNARNVLSGGAGLAVGSLVWDATGARTGGYGVGINALGLVGYNSAGALTFSLNASTGAVAVAGDISGSSGTFGDVIVGTSLRCGQTAYDTGTGFWFGFVGTVPKASMGVAGGAGWKWDGTNLTITNATLSTPTVTGTGAITSTGANGTRTFPISVTAANGRAGYTYLWSMAGASQFQITSGDGTNSIVVSATGTNVNYVGYARCVVTDANGQAAVFTCHLDVTFGTPP